MSLEEKLELVFNNNQAISASNQEVKDSNPYCTLFQSKVPEWSKQRWARK